MKVLVKGFGILLVIAGVILLAYSEFAKLESNSLLVWSMVLIIGGLIVYIILNNIFE